MDSTNNIQLFLPAINADSNNGISLIAVDLRRETTYLSYFVTENKKVISKLESTEHTLHFGSLSEIILKFISENNLSNISKIAIAVPGPVIAGKSEPARLSWKIDAEEIKRDTQVDKVYLINDLEASAYGLGSEENSYITIRESEEFTPGNVALLSPSAGLGEAGLFWDGSYLRPFATEGGHCEFSPRTSDEVEFYQFLQKIYGIVSWESVLSNSGLFNIYRFLRDVKQQEQPDWLTKEIDADNFTKAIIEGAIENKDRICTMTIETFIIFLAREANSMVLKLKATGGLFLTGELSIMMQQFLTNDKFYKNFIISDKMEGVLKDIPIYLVNDKKIILNGAAIYGAFSEE